MKLVELYKKYLETDFSKEKVDELFKESFSFRRLPVAKTIEVIQNALQKCVEEDDGFRYIHLSLSEIGLEVVKVYSLTDIEAADEDDEKIEGKNSYDLVFEMGLADYIAKNIPGINAEFDYFVKCEMDTFNRRHSMDSAAEKAFAIIADKFSELSDKAGAVLDNIERFDPKQITEVQEILNNMNNTVEEVRGLQKTD